MTTNGGAVRAEVEAKQCCANLYQSDLARYLFGDSFHPGGLAMTRRLGEMLALNPNSRVLDVACGTGTSAVFLAKEFGCEVRGIDYGQKNIDAARALAKIEELKGRVQFERSDAEILPFADESFDALICECAFCTFPKKSLAAAEFFRVLRPGGRIGLSDVTRAEVLSSDLNGLLAWIACMGDAQTVENYASHLRNSGFSADHVEPHDAALQEMVDQVRLKLFGAEIMTGLKKLQLPGVDLTAAKEMASSAMAAVKKGQLGYALICATKQDRAGR